MATAIINIKTDLKVKKEAQKITADLGLTLSGAINGFLKQLIRNRAVVFSLNEDHPSEYLMKSLELSAKERRSGKTYSFKNNKEALNFIKNQ